VCPRRYPFRPTSGSNARNGAPGASRVSSTPRNDTPGASRVASGLVAGQRVRPMMQQESNVVVRKGALLW
jgi:hypothetical protein